jgi:hypothetical protein
MVVDTALKRLLAGPNDKVPRRRWLAVELLPAARWCRGPTSLAGWMRPHAGPMSHEANIAAGGRRGRPVHAFACSGFEPSADMIEVIPLRQRERFAPPRSSIGR